MEAPLVGFRVDRAVQEAGRNYEGIDLGVMIGTPITSNGLHPSLAA